MTQVLHSLETHGDAAALLIVALLALGMALAFVAADRASPISRAMAAALAAIGAAIGLNVTVAAPMHARHDVPFWDGVFAIPETLAFVCAFEWMLRILRTDPAADRVEQKLLRLAQALAVFYGLASLAFPDLRAHQFINLLRHGADGEAHDPVYPAFMLFAAPLAAGLLLATVAGTRAHKRHRDPAETRRGLAFLAGAPFLALGMILPVHAAPFAAATGLLIFLVGAVQFHVIQGQRAAFMARFLAPQVAQMVARHGLHSAIGVRTVELSVVCCDLRGFTAYAAATTPQHVMEVLREYYDEVGAATASHGGTVKDQAGDGVLILIGAPLPFDDHGLRALRLARDIRSRGMRMAGLWSDGTLKLGIGVGVASGTVTVGVIGANSRLEYTAVGTAVNLASRLCAEAADGEILVAPETRAMTASVEVAMTTARALQLKGFAKPVQTYSLSATDVSRTRRAPHCSSERIPGNCQTKS
ncbi:MAG: adenylate/guanylate cyclase domain-containing protein [Burkholderiales bacterium]|nr:adenylate/guanylate cyclase domain-containing protein [Burkholderiales bacterium]